MAVSLPGSLDCTAGAEPEATQLLKDTFEVLSAGSKTLQLHRPFTKLSQLADSAGTALLSSQILRVNLLSAARIPAYIPVAMLDHSHAVN